MKRIPDDISKLKKNLEDLKKKEHLGEPQTKNSYETASSLGFQIGVEIVAGTTVGGSVGYFLDDLFDIQPVLLIIFLLIGGAAGFLNAYRTAKNFENNEK